MNELTKYNLYFYTQFTSIQTGKFIQYAHPLTTQPAKKKNLIISHC